MQMQWCRTAAEVSDGVPWLVSYNDGFGSQLPQFSKPLHSSYWTESAWLRRPTKYIFMLYRPICAIAKNIIIYINIWTTTLVHDRQHWMEDCHLHVRIQSFINVFSVNQHGHLVIQRMVPVKSCRPAIIVPITNVASGWWALFRCQTLIWIRKWWIQRANDAS